MNVLIKRIDPHTKRTTVSFAGRLEVACYRHLTPKNQPMNITRWEALLVNGNVYALGKMIGGSDYGDANYTIEKLPADGIDWSELCRVEVPPQRKHLRYGGQHA